MLIMNASEEAMAFILLKAAEYDVPAVFPTDTIYGIGAPLSSLSANRKIYDIKNRPYNKPFPILAANIEQAEKYADLSNITEEKHKYLDRWPGPYTFILKAKNNVPDIFKNNGKIAIRIPKTEWLRNAIKKINEPVTATSVNLNGEKPFNDLQTIIKTFGNKISLFINGEPERNINSEIFDMTGEKPVKLR